MRSICSFFILLTELLMIVSLTILCPSMEHKVKINPYHAEEYSRLVPTTPNATIVAIGASAQLCQVQVLSHDVSLAQK